MNTTLSRSEKKRQAEQIEQLALELVSLPENEIRALPCDRLVRDEIITARKLKTGARKRQIKFIAKELRRTSPEPLLAFLAEKKGSQLKEKREFHLLELLREEIITEAIQADEEARERQRPLAADWPGPGLEKARKLFPALDTEAVKRSALRYAKTRKPVHSREVFRLLRAAQERALFLQQRNPATTSRTEI